jgi:hypothetical protein
MWLGVGQGVDKPEIRVVGLLSALSMRCSTAGKVPMLFLYGTKPTNFSSVPTG